MNRRLFAAGIVAALLIVPMGLPALADHTDPTEPLSVTDGAPADGVAEGLGTWTFIRNFPPNPGTDLELIHKGKAVYSSSGTLGQGDEQHVGQRILRLVNSKGKVNPKWIADHGSAHCTTANPSGTTGLQHDVQITPKRKTELIIDATDATGRCHDSGTGGGGLEFISAVGMQKKNFKPREIHLTRHDGYSHNMTVDDRRPWIVYNSTSDTGRPWVDVLDISSCLGLSNKTIKQRRALCRPEVFRIPFKNFWTTARNTDGDLAAADDGFRGPTGCHDITVSGFRLYCAAINGTAVFNTKHLTKPSGAIRGEPLPCKLLDGTNTTAKVTSCDLGAGNDAAAADRDAYKELGKPQAGGWRLVTHINHPGRNQGSNNNTDVRSDEGIAVSHEADPIMNGKFMLVTDERGGGVVPGGASCTPGVDNPYGNGGMHVYDIRNPDNPRYAKMPGGEKAIFISSNVTAAPTFCNIHVIEKIPGEQRVIMAWYNQGFKIVDYFIDGDGRWSFDEVSSYNIPGANTWTVEDFKIKNNGDGTRTYWFMGSDIQRGIDIVKWRGPTNRNGERADEVLAARASGSRRGNLGLVVASLTVLPLAALFGRRRRRLAH